MQRQTASARKTTLLLALLLSAGARAAEVRFDGSYRLRYASNTNLLLDESDRLGQTNWFEHRLRLTPKIVEEGKAEIQASFDLISGIVGGDLAPDFRGLGWDGRSERTGIDARGFDFRHFFATLRFPAGVLQFGQMPNQWGMGMLINGGNAEDESDFGDQRFGDIVERLLFVTRPFTFLGERSALGRNLALAVGGDLVYRDRYATLFTTGNGGLHWADMAWQLVSALIYDPSPDSRAGLYVTRRIQSFAGGAGDLHVWVLDAHFRHSRLVESLGAVFSVEAEAAQIYGGTSHAPTLSAPGTQRVNQQGAAARVRLAKGTVEGELEGGYASGDGDPYDDQANAFMMSRDFKVGLVLFDEVLLFHSQNTARRLSDPSLGAPPQGLDLLPTEGAVSNALYVRPTLRVAIPAVEGLRLIGSVIYAVAPAPVLDLYQVTLSSSARNTFGHTAGRSYGVELDGAVSYRKRLGSTLGLEAGVQAGLLLPGNAFDRLDGSRMPKTHTVKFRGTLVF